MTVIPGEALSNGLTERTAIIQDTYRADKTYMYFDEALYLRLLEYAKCASQGGEVEVFKENYARESATLIGKWFGRLGGTEAKQTLEDFLGEWATASPNEKEPPSKVVVRNGGVPTMCIATEFWTRIGGPLDYADSYTYSVFSSLELGDEIRAFLAASPSADSWILQTAP